MSLPLQLCPLLCGSRVFDAALDPAFGMPPTDDPGIHTVWARLVGTAGLTEQLQLLAPRPLVGPPPAPLAAMADVVECWAQASFSYATEEPEGVSFEENDVLKVLQREDNGWWKGVVRPVVCRVPGTLGLPMRVLHCSTLSCECWCRVVVIALISGPMHHVLAHPPPPHPLRCAISVSRTGRRAGSRRPTAKRSNTQTMRMARRGSN